MAELSKEIFDSLPDAVKGDYQEKDGVYVHTDSLKARALKESLNGLDAKYKEQGSRLDSFEAEKAKAIEEARNKALEEARTKGDIKAIEERYQQQMADLESRSYEKGKLEALTEYKSNSAKEKAAGIASTLGAQLGIDADAGEAISLLIASRVEVDPETGKEIYRDSTGSATSLDKAGFIAELKKEARFKYLIKADVTAGGAGLVKGNNGSFVPSKDPRQAKIDAINAKFGKR